MSIRIALMAPLLGLALSACVGNDPNVGTGPITLSQGTQKHFEAYQKERSPGYFAVAVDGNGSSYNYCSEGRCLRSSANRVLYRCEKLADGRPCKIYASKGKVVWKEEVDTVEN